MISIKYLTDEELLVQIECAQDDLDSADFNTGDYNAALAEKYVAEKEARRRGLKLTNNWTHNCVE